MYTLNSLPYAYNALEPVIDEATMRFHHDKHHQSYLDKFNQALEGLDHLKKLSAPEILWNFNEKIKGKVSPKIETAIKNNGGGFVHHDIFWQVMSPDGSREPQGEIREMIRGMGGVDKFKETFSNLALKQFGAGWAWLVVNEDKDLELYSLPNQDSPLLKKHFPILGLDVWEHAYYLRYQNRRADYIKEWWKVVDWAQVEKRYQAALAKK